MKTESAIETQEQTRKGALNVRFTLDLLTSMLGLPAGQEVVYAGDYDYVNRTIKLTITGPNLPVPRPGVYPADGYLDAEIDSNGRIVAHHVVTFDPSSQDIGG